MTNKLLLSVCVSLFMLSYAVRGQEMSEVSQTAVEVEQAQESKSIIQQAVAQENDADEKAKVWIPSAVNYDWIQLTSNEWLKGEIKGMYLDSLEFDSDKLDLLEIDWDDVKILRSYRAHSINIDGVGATSGVLEVTGNSVKIINDYDDEAFDRIQLISFAPGGKRERDLWSIKATLSLDLKQGNTDSSDFTAQLDVKRRTSVTRFLMDYIGTISRTNGGEGSQIETVNNHRLNASYNYFKTRYFFIIPVFAELYRDPFTNIDLKTTLGGGLGYILIDDGRTELSIGGGPAYLETDFISVSEGQNSSESTVAAVIRTNYDIELTKTLDFIAKYNIQIGNTASGGYTHHIILTLEHEITGSLDIDTSFIWDRTSHPTVASDGNRPEPDDYRITLGISYTY